MMKSNNDNMPEFISFAHGSGGRLTHDLIKQVFARQFANPYLSPLADAAIAPFSGESLAFTTDGFVVHPLEFPGGDIGKLAVCGTVNDLAVMGAKPLYLSCAMIIEEQLEFPLLERIAASIAQAAEAAQVLVVTGDTKVVERGKGDGLFITMSGVGAREYALPQPIAVGDNILVNGALGDHALAVLAARREFGFDIPVASDCAPLSGLIASVLAAHRSVKFMRDPTRGGLAMVLNEIAEGQPFGIALDEAAIPVNDSVRAACALLGFDPLYLANEGKVVLIVGANEARGVLETMRRHPFGRESAMIGEIVDAPAGLVFLRTTLGGKRILDMPVGSPLPRIC